MYIFKNSLISIIRNKGRNLLIGIIVIVISCAAAVTLAIKNSASSLIKSYEEQYEVTATLGVNRESMRGEMRPSEDRNMRNENMQEIFQNAISITVSDIENYANSKYVKDYYYQVSIGVNSNDLEKASISFNGDNNSPQMSMMPNGKEDFKNIPSTANFTLVGYSKMTAMEEFISGRYTIKEGKISDEDNTCVINIELATLNDININDEVSFTNPNNEDDVLTLKVTGIYEESSENESAMGMFTTSVNNIITTSETVNEFIKLTDTQVSITPTFILNNKDVVEQFNEELKDKGLSEYLTLTTNLDEVENATNTIDNVNTFAITFLIITLIIGGIVLFVINMINIRERKYEIGVLRTIGMSKIKLTCQFILETLIVSFVALLIGASIGSCISVPVSNQLLQNEINQTEEKKEEINNNFGPGDGNFRLDNKHEKINGVIEVETIDSINAAVDLKVLIQLFGIGILLTLVSSSAAMVSIQKFSPLTILKERS